MDRSISTHARLTERAKLATSGASRRLALFCWLLTTAATYGPWAQADGHTARDQFYAGVQAFGAEDYVEALAAFEQSYELKAKPAVLLNIGMCQKALFRFVEAIATFQHYLELGDATKEERRSEVRAEIVELERLVGGLHLQGIPTGAQVLIDEISVDVESLAEAVRSNPGRHTIEVSLDGYETFNQEVVVESGATHPVAVILEPVPVPSTISPAVLVATDQSRLLNELAVARAHKRNHIISWSSIGVGAAAVCVGFGFHLKRVNDLATGNRAVEEFDQELYDEVRNERIPRDNAGMIASYAVAGVFLTTGIVLLLNNPRSTEKHQRLSLRPTWSGVQVTF